jgi:type IV secretory pathway TrbD component
MEVSVADMEYDNGLLIAIVIVVALTHCPAFGVKVYVVVAVLLIVGDQVPLMLFVEMVGKAGIDAPDEYGPT